MRNHKNLRIKLKKNKKEMMVKRFKLTKNYLLINKAQNFKKTNLKVLVRAKAKNLKKFRKNFPSRNKKFKAVKTRINRNLKFKKREKKE